MDKVNNQKAEIAYVYIRDGVEYYTTNEQLASKRTDTGTYRVIYSDHEEKSKDSE